MDEQQSLYISLEAVNNIAASSFTCHDCIESVLTAKAFPQLRLSTLKIAADGEVWSNEDIKEIATESLGLASTKLSQLKCLTQVKKKKCEVHDRSMKIRNPMSKINFLKKHCFGELQECIILKRNQLQIELSQLFKEADFCPDCEMRTIALYQQAFLLQQHDRTIHPHIDIVQNYNYYCKTGDLLDGVTYLYDKDVFELPAEGVKLLDEFLTLNHALRDEHNDLYVRLIEQAFANMLKSQFHKLWNKVYFELLKETAREMAVYSLSSSLMVYRTSLQHSEQSEPIRQEAKKTKERDQRRRKKERMEEVLKQVMGEKEVKIIKGVKSVEWVGLPAGEQIERNFKRLLDSLEESVFY